MARIRVDLSPELLPNPDLDLRYELPQLLSKIPSSTITVNGYDYSDGTPPTLMIFLTSCNLLSDVEIAVRFLSENEVLENRILEAAKIYTSNDEGESWEMVFPAFTSID